MTMKNEQDSHSPAIPPLPPATGSAKRLFEVMVIGYKTVIVEADDSEEAMELASEECTSSNWEIDEWKMEKEFQTREAANRAIAHGAVPIDRWNG